MAENRKKYALLLKNVRVVRPRKNTVDECDIAIRGGKIKKIAGGIDIYTNTNIVVEELAWQS